MAKILFHTIAVIAMILLFLFEWQSHTDTFGLANSILMLVIGPIQLFMAVKSLAKTTKEKNAVIVYIILSIASIIWIVSDHRIDIDDIAMPSEQFYLQTRIAPLTLALFYVSILFKNRAKMV